MSMSAKTATLTTTQRTKKSHTYPIIDLSNKGNQMKVTVLLNGQTTDYFFAPEHYQTAFASYTQMQADGVIDAFSITL